MIILIFKYNNYFIGGVAKPGQTRRTQDKLFINDKSRPSGVRGFESHLLHLTKYFGNFITHNSCIMPTIS